MEKTHKILVLPDIHGRTFWKKPCENIEAYDAVIFLGDYLDPYRFDGITYEEAIDNFKEILQFSNSNTDKVTMLLGNHDLPYYDADYRMLSRYHSRIAPYELWDAIEPLYKEYPFKIACVSDDILFTHAGVQSDWLEWAFPDYKFEGDLGELSEKLNGLLCKKGYGRLFAVAYSRGGDYPFASCVWIDVNDMLYDYKMEPPHPKIREVRQVFGHTVQGRYDPEDRKRVIYGEPVEFSTFKMVDTASAYVLDTENFTVEKVS